MKVVINGEHTELKKPMYVPLASVSSKGRVESTVVKDDCTGMIVLDFLGDSLVGIEFLPAEYLKEGK